MQKLSGLFLFAVLISGAFSSSLAFAQTPTLIFEDDYSTGLGSWEYHAIGNASLVPNPIDNYFPSIVTSDGQPAPSVLISGDGYAISSGIRTHISIPSDATQVTLTFDGKSQGVFSSHNNIPNLLVTVFDENDQIIYNQYEIGGANPSSVSVTPWETFTVDLTDAVIGHNNVSIKLGLADSWTTNYDQKIWIDNVFVEYTSVPHSSDIISEDDFYSVDEDSLLIVNPVGVLFNDTNTQSNTFLAIIHTDVGFGILTLNSDGSFTYQPAQDFDSTDSFTYVTNNGTHNGNEATVTISVNPINDAPIAQDDNAETQQNVPIRIDVLENDFDVEDDSLNVLLTVDPSETKGIVELEGFEVLFTPIADFVGETTFSYLASDGDKTSNSAQVTVTVNAVDDPNDDSILDQILEQIQSLIDRVLNLEDKITQLQEENSVLAMRITELESIVENWIPTNDDDDNNEKILVCHKDKKTISISEHGLSGHLKHGDVVGECNDSNDDEISEKTIKNQIKALKNNFKAQEKDLKNQLKDLTKDKKHHHDDDD